MKRRSFLGFLGGAAVAGPKVAQSAASMTMADLSPAGVLFDNGDGGPVGMELPDSRYHVEHCRTWLSRLIGRSAAVREQERRTHHIHGLDPQVAPLRSVALHHKITMSRDRAYERSVASRKSYLEGVIAGLWE